MATGPFGSSISSKFFRQSGVPVIRGANLSADPTTRLSDKNLVFLEPEKAAEFSRSTVHRGDLIFTCWGTINQVGLIDESAGYDTYIISNKQMKLTPDPSLADAEFLYYLFSSPEMQQIILEGSIGSSIPGFNLARLKSLKVALPPLREQTRIALALTTAESLEAALSRAIAKKEAIKRGMMQQLLTGKTRLPGFEDEWRATTFGDTVVIRRGEVFVGREAARGGSVPVIAAGREPATYANRGNRTGPVVTISASGASAGYVAYHRTSIFASDCSTISPCPGFDLRFIYFLLALRQNNIYRAQTGGAQPHVHAKDIYPMEVSLPPTVEEQRAIASVLDDADRQVGVLRARLSKARSMSQGMMEQLLTGRTRLPGKEAAA